MSSVSKICALDWCDSPARAKGLCSFHYKRQWAGIPLDAPIVYKGARRVGKICAHDGCDRPIKTWDLCNLHSERKKNGLDMDAPAKKGAKKGAPKYTTPIEYRQAAVHVLKCVISGCQKVPRAFYLTCKAHTARSIRFSITPIQLQMIIDTELCEICESPFDGQDSSRHIDHDHSCCPRATRKCCGVCIRGVLCRNCNLGIGALGDDMVTMLKAIEYLKRLT